MNTQTLMGWYAVMLCAMLSLSAGAQDIHYAHLAAVPTQTNPAYTGLMEGRARVGIDYRGQWNNFTKGFRTSSFSADMKAWQSREDIIGIGVHLNNDVAGDLNFTSQQLSINSSFMKGLDGGKTFLSFGIQNVFNSQRIDWSEARAFSYEPLESLESGGRGNFWDIGFGLAFFNKPNRRLSWFAGAAGAHLNNPDVTFLGDSDNSLGDRLYRKWTLHAGAEVHFGRFNSLRPSVIYLTQGPNRQLKVGTYWRYKTDNGLSSDSQVAVHFGAFLRSYLTVNEAGVDAFIFAARFDYHQTVITISFDTNVSSLTTASNGFGGPEFSLVQSFDWGSLNRKSRPVKCPTFQY